MGVADGGIPAGRGQQTPKARNEVFVLNACAEWLNLIGIECAEAEEQIVFVGHAVIQPGRELVGILDLLSNRRQVLDRTFASGNRNAGQERPGHRIDAILRNTIVRKRSALAGNSGKGVADGFAAEDTGPHVHRRYRKRPGYRSPRALFFIAAEQKGPVGTDRAAGRESVLALAQGWNRLVRVVEIVVRIEAIVANKTENASVQCIGPRPGRHIDQRRRLAAEFGRIHRFLDLELLNGIHGWVDDQIVEQLVGHLDAIQQVDVVAGALAANVGERSRLLQRGAPRTARGNHDRVAQLRQLQELAPVQRHLDDTLVFDHVADLGVRTLKKRRGCRDHDQFIGYGTHLQHQVEIQSLPDRQRHR